MRGKPRALPAGQALAKQLPKDEAPRLLVVLADAHSPKNQSLVEGVQKALGGEFPINTSGGLLGEAYIHGMNGIAEVVRQIAVVGDRGCFCA